jgi:hypothetical protein
MVWVPQCDRVHAHVALVHAPVARGRDTGSSTRVAGARTRGIGASGPVPRCCSLS